MSDAARRDRELRRTAGVSGDERWFRSLVENATEVVTILEADGTVRYVSPAIERVLGYRPEELAGTSILDLVHADDVERALGVLAGILETPGIHPPLEFRVPHKDGSWRYLEHVVNNLLDDPSVGGIVVNSRDVTERKLLQERLEYETTHDPLTGLPNRTLFMDRLERALTRASRHDHQVAVLFVDLDGFKPINDSLGHEVGDELLLAVADRLGEAVRASDTVARFGDDEFAVLLGEVADEAEVMKVAGRIQEKFGCLFLVGGREVSIEASVGISRSVSKAEKPKDLLRRADAALYRAKRRKTPYRVYGPTADPRPRLRSQRGLELKGRLRRAIERREFVLFYQPMVRLGEVDTIAQTEALLRWEHPERGLLLPDEFMPLVEETMGLIVPLGRWVLREACRQAREWQERYPGEPSLSVCVNLSTEQIRYPGLIQDVGSALSESGLGPGNLVLEITESTLMQDTEANEILVGELKALGVRLAIDDFGREYSSLSYLKRLPVDVLKIDRSFVENLGKDPRDATIVEAMISLSHSLGLEAVGEGVENAEQLEHLRRMGCDLVQGHHLAWPLPGVEVAPLLADRLIF